MKRSAGVVAAALVAMLGSAFMLLMALLTVLSVVLSRFLPQQNGIAAAGTAAVTAIALFYLALGGGGFATALGVLKLRPWARIPMIIFGGFTAFTCVFTGLLVFFIPMPAVPNSNLTPADWSHVRVVTVAMFAIPAAIGVWWLVLFNLRSTRQQFTAGAPAAASLPPPIPTDAASRPAVPAAGPARPVSITIIACLYLLGALSLPYTLMGNHPAIFLGRLVWGRSATALVLLTLAATLYAGIELLRLRPAARIVGICLTLYGVLNSLLFVLLPGADARFGEMMSTMQVPTVLPMSAFLTIIRFSMLAGAAVSIVILWILIANKSVFRRA